MRIVALGLLLVLAAGNAEAKNTAGATAMRACAAQWDAKKAAKQTDGQSYRDFSKACLSAPKGVAVAATSPVTATAAPATRPSILSSVTKRSSAATTTTNASTAAIAPATPVLGSATMPARSTASSAKSITASPAGATGQCKDGTFTHATHHGGACSGHGGVAKWM